jgi:hypothetical protein
MSQFRGSRRIMARIAEKRAANRIRVSRRLTDAERDMINRLDTEASKGSGS